MLRRIIVMRHAKSSWSSPATADHQRPLNERGRRDAPRVGAQLAQLGWTPERVLSSDSVRTRETWGLLADAFAPAPKVSFLPELYLAGPTAVDAAIGELADAIASVMVLGHNVGWEEVVTWLSGEEVSLTTANAALLEGEGTTWQEALACAPCWTLRQVLRPKEF